MHKHKTHHMHEAPPNGTCRPELHTHTHAHTYIRTYIPTHIHTQTHPNTHIHKYMTVHSFVGIVCS